MDEREEIIKRAVDRPLEWFPHDSDAHNDESIQRFCREWADLHPGTDCAGFTAYGMYWCLCEVLAADKHHQFEIGDGFSRQRLMYAMGSLAFVSDSEFDLFLELLAKYGLVNSKQFNENDIVVSNRMVRNVQDAAKRTASRVFGGRKGSQGRWKSEGKPSDN